MSRYDELMLIEDIKQVLISDDNYFNVYEKFIDREKEKCKDARQ